MAGAFVTALVVSAFPTPWLAFPFFLVWLAVRDGLLGTATLVAALVLAPALHAAEVGHNVFRRW